MKSTEWINAKYKLPEPITLNLVCVENCENSVVIAQFNGEKWYRNNHEINITHWMPLPSGANNQTEECLEVGDKFWYLTSIGNISETTYCCGGDDVKIAQGNAFLTSENTRAEIMRLWGDGE